MFAGKDAIPGNGPLGAHGACGRRLRLGRAGAASARSRCPTCWRRRSALADGFPMYEFLHHYLETERAACEPYAWTMSTYYPGGRITPVGEMFRQPNLAATLRLMSKADSRCSRRGSDARDRRSRPGAMRSISAPPRATSRRRCKDAGGVMTEEDLASYHSKIEEPLSVPYRGYTVYKTGFWNQGPVLLQTLRILEGFDLRAMGAGLGGRAAYDGRGDQAGLCGPRSLLRRSGLRPGAGRGAVVGAVRGCPSRADRPPAARASNSVPAIRSTPGR